MKKNNRHPNRIMCLAGILFCLTLFSMHLTSGLYAKYAASGTSGDQGRVAKFSIEQTGDLAQLIELEVYPGFSSQTYTIALENNSEVDVAYTIYVERLTENLPLNLTLTDSNVSGDGGIEATGTMDANGGETVEHDLRIAWPQNAGNDETYSYEIDAIRVTVRAEQID